MTNIATNGKVKPAARVGVVVAGYVAAFAIAVAVARVLGADAATQHAYPGMTAFGDSVLFLGTLGVASLPATGAALFFLRSRHTFWLVLTVASLGVAATAVLATFVILAPSPARPDQAIATWRAMAPLRIFAAPPLALLFALAAVFAPTRSTRIQLACATAAEVVAFTATVLSWVLSRR